MNYTYQIPQIQVSERTRNGLRHSSEENDQGIVDLVVSSSTEYTYNASNDRLIGQGSGIASDRLDGTSETIDFALITLMQALRGMSLNLQLAFK